MSFLNYSDRRGAVSNILNDGHSRNGPGFKIFLYAMLLVKYSNCILLAFKNVFSIFNFKSAFRSLSHLHMTIIHTHILLSSWWKQDGELICLVIDRWCLRDSSCCTAIPGVYHLRLLERLYTWKTLPCISEGACHGNNWLWDCFLGEALKSVIPLPVASTRTVPGGLYHVTFLYHWIAELVLNEALCWTEQTFYYNTRGPVEATLRRR